MSESEEIRTEETDKRIKLIATANYGRIKWMIKLGKKIQEEEIIDKMKRPDVPLEEIVPILMGRYVLSEKYALELIEYFKTEP